MRVSKMLANITPACGCRGYIEEGDTLKVVAGSMGQRAAWWVACPDCGDALGRAFDYPIVTSQAALERRGYKNESNFNGYQT